MRGDIYLKTLHDLRGQILAWSLGLAVLAAANVLLYPTVQNMPGLVAFLENMPPVFKAMVGDVRSLVQLEGFLRAKLFDPLPLLLAVFAVSHGAQLIAGEVEQKSIDLVMARPVPRWRVVLAKSLALATATVMLCGALAVSVVICARFVDAKIGAGYLILATGTSLPLTWVFGALALVGSCLLPRVRQAALLAGGFVVASYVFETLRLLSPALQNWGAASLFAHHKAGFSLAGEFHARPVLLLVGLAAALLGAAMVAWERRDVAS